MARLLLILSIFVTLSCSSGIVTKEKSLASVQIGHCHLETVYRIVRDEDPEARRYRLEREKVEEDRQRIIRGQKEGTIPVPVAVSDLRRLDGVLQDIRAREEPVKQRILEEIEEAVALVVKEENLDYVLDSGTGLIYGSREFDITSRVVDEVRENRKRRDEKSR